MGMKLTAVVRTFLIVLIGACCVAAMTPGSVPSSDREDSLPIVSEGSAPTAVLADVSKLAQRAERNVMVEELNPEEELEYERVPNTLSPAASPRVLPQHQDEIDTSSSTDRPEVFRADAVAPPTLSPVFPGIGNTGKGQPDSIIAVGPAGVLVAVNRVVALYSKNGHRLFQTSFDNWFSPLDNIYQGANTFDPRVLYDQYTGRYVFLVTARGAGRRSWILLSVSKTSNPRGEWAFWALDMQINGTSRDDTVWADFPRLGVDQKALYITSNMYSFTYRFHYSKIRVLKKSDVLKFGTLPWVEFRRMVDASGVQAHSIEPAHSYGSAPAEFLVNTNSEGGDHITLWKIFQDAHDATKLARIVVPVTSFALPPLAQQRGGGAIINTATEGIGPLSVIYRFGSIYTVFPVSKDWGSGAVSALRYYQLTPTGSVTREVTYGSDKNHYFMPSLAVDTTGGVVMAFSKCSPSQFAGFYYTGRRKTDPAGKFSRSMPMQAGFANWQVVFRGSNIGVWGDYNGITAAGDGSFWAFGQYAATRTEWQTVIGRLKY